MSKMCKCCLITVLATMSLAAADDIRFTYTSGSEEFIFAPPGLSGEDRDWNDSTRLEIGLWNVVPGATSWGIAGLKQEAEYRSAEFDVEFATTGGRLYFAQHYPLSTSLNLEIQSFIGWARTELTLHQGGLDYSDDNWLYEYGLIVELMFTGNPNQGLVVGAGAGYIFSKGEFTVADQDVDLDQEGWVIMATVGWRF